MISMGHGTIINVSSDTLHYIRHEFEGKTWEEAFNSPFWPFVLATTSVGQEGLDFHCYCHAVVHWNLPSNPVDLEQREGRVHRFKGHAVRRNVAATYGEAILSEDLSHEGWVDDWTRLFARATEHRTDDSDIVPYWIFTDGPAKIERHVDECRNTNLTPRRRPKPNTCGQLRLQPGGSAHATCSPLTAHHFW